MRFVRSGKKIDEKGLPIKGRGSVALHRKKYPNRLIFDSKAEYLTYKKLKSLEKQGKISDLKLQVEFELIPPQVWFNNVLNKKRKLRPTKYICDFVFVRDGKKIALDCKGWVYRKDKKTGKKKWVSYTDDIYKIKKKLFIYLYTDYIFEEL